MSNISQTMREIFLSTVEAMINDGLEELIINQHDDFMVTKNNPKSDDYFAIDKTEIDGVFYYLNTKK